jgi:hypothetical protein
MQNAPYLQLRKIKPAWRMALKMLEFKKKFG